MAGGEILTPAIDVNFSFPSLSNDTSQRLARLLQTFIYVRTCHALGSLRL